MWLGLSNDQFYSLIEEHFIYISKILTNSSFPNFEIPSASFWLKIDDRFEKLDNDFSGPVFISHIKLCLPVTKDAVEIRDAYTKQYPQLKPFLRSIEDVL